MLIIGIDPGTTTGLSAWIPDEKRLHVVTSMKIHEAMNYPLLQSASIILVEDARKRTWFAGSGKEKLQGAGSIKRDSTIWEDYLGDLGVPFVMTHPKNVKTKLNAVDFKSLTKWPARTNEHERDSAMLIYGMTAANVESLLTVFRANATRSHR